MAGTRGRTRLPGTAVRRWQQLAPWRWAALVRGARLEPPGHGWKDGDTTGGTDPAGMGPLGMGRAGRSRGWDRWPASVLPNKEPVQPRGHLGTHGHPRPGGHCRRDTGVSQALVPPSGARRARCLLALMLVALGDSVCPWYPIRKKEMLEEGGELVSPEGSQCRPPW